MRTRLLAAITPTDVILGALALISLGAIVYLAVTGRDVPAVLPTVITTVIGFYVGTKATQAPPPSQPPGGTSQWQK